MSDIFFERCILPVSSFSCNRENFHVTYERQDFGLSWYSVTEWNFIWVHGTGLDVEWFNRLVIIWLFFIPTFHRGDNFTDTNPKSVISVDAAARVNDLRDRLENGYETGFLFRNEFWNWFSFRRSPVGQKHSAPVAMIRCFRTLSLVRRLRLGKNKKICAPLLAWHINTRAKVLRDRNDTLLDWKNSTKVNCFWHGLDVTCYGTVPLQ